MSELIAGVLMYASIMVAVWFAVGLVHLFLPETETWGYDERSLWYGEYQ